MKKLNWNKTTKPTNYRLTVVALALLIVAGILLTIITPPKLSAQDVDDFFFHSFDVRYYLDKNDKGVSTMRINETLVVQFPNFDQNHGIIRAIPQTYDNYELSPKIISVANISGVDQPYTTYSENNNLILKIGDPNTYVSGQHAYVIEYQVKNVVTFYEDYDELFWDVNGDQWEQPFERVTATLHIPEEIAAKYLYQEKCFSGSFGSADNDCNIKREQRDRAIIVEANALDLEPRENLSFLVGFEKGLFKEDSWPATRLQINKLFLVIIPSITGVIVFQRWQRTGRDPAGKGIVPQYAPPKDLSVMAAKTIVEEDFKPAYISAGILELATSGYLKIYEERVGKLRKRSQYEVELIKSGEKLSSDQQILIKDIFGSLDVIGGRYNLSQNPHKLSGTANKLNSHLPKRLTKEDYFVENPLKTITKYILLGVVGFAISGLIFIVSGAQFWGILAGSGIAALIVMAFAKFMPAKTEKGTLAKEYILGIKDYIDLAEQDRIRFLQSPEGVRQFGNPASRKSQLNIYEALLPYAMVFGMEKQWTKEFSNLYNEPPDWYSSSRPFTAAYLASGISGVASAASSSFSSPSSSGSSSGFSSGGGFSGGGGGGGGGGGW